MLTTPFSDKLKNKQNSEVNTSLAIREEGNCTVGCGKEGTGVF